MESNKDKKKRSYKNLNWILGFPIVWGLFGLLQGEGFFPYIYKNIIALIILAIIFVALLLILVFIIDK